MSTFLVLFVATLVLFTTCISVIYVVKNVQDGQKAAARLPRPKTDSMVNGDGVGAKSGVPVGIRSALDKTNSHQRR